MKNTLSIVVTLFLLSSFEVRAQRGPVLTSLYQMQNVHNVICKTSTATISFSHQDVIDRFERVKTESWFTGLSDVQKKKYEAAIAWLKSGNSITLSEKATSAKYAAELND